MNWFQEKQYEDFSQTLSIEHEIYAGRTQYQDAVIFENRAFGNVLALDGIVQLTDRDNHIYHEMMAHAPMFMHGAAERILIIGGGDGGVLNEVLRHRGVRHVSLVELDSEVITLSRKYFPEVSEKAFDDARLTLVIGDGAAFVADNGVKFDIIIIDSTDPIGPGEALYTDKFYENCRRRLRPGGTITTHAGAAFFQPEKLKALRSRLTLCFGAAACYLAPVPTYAAGMLALVTAGTASTPLIPDLDVLKPRFAKFAPRLRFYSPEVHHAAHVMATAIAED